MASPQKVSNKLKKQQLNTQPYTDTCTHIQIHVKPKKNKKIESYY